MIGHSNRCVLCNKITKVFDFIISWLSTTATLGYIVLFDYDVSPNVYIAMIVFICLRFVFTILGSYAVFIGLKLELKKVLTQLGTDLTRVKTVRDMVQHIQEEDDVQLMIMSQLVALT